MIAFTTSLIEITAVPIALAAIHCPSLSLVQADLSFILNDGAHSHRSSFTKFCIRKDRNPGRYDLATLLRRLVMKNQEWKRDRAQTNPCVENEPTNEMGLSITGAAEIDEAALWICVEELHPYFLAYAKALLSAHNAPINGRPNQTRKDAFG